MRKYVTLELDKPRQLRFGINALLRLEEVLGFSIMEIATHPIGLKEVRTIISIGLSNNGEILTEEQTGDLIDEYSSIEEITEKMTEAFNLSFGTKNTDEVKKKSKMIPKS